MVKWFVLFSPWSSDLCYLVQYTSIVGSSPCQTKDNKIDICCISAKHAALRSKEKFGR